MKPQPGWPGFLSRSSLGEGALRLPFSLNSDPSLCPGAVRSPRGTAAHASPLPSAPAAASPHSFGSGSRGADERTGALEPFGHLSPGADPLTPGSWAAGCPETPRNSRALRAGLHLFKFIITILSVNAASLAPVRARCGVSLCTVRAFLGSAPASWHCSLFQGWPRLFDHGVSLIS